VDAAAAADGHYEVVDDILDYFDELLDYALQESFCTDGEQAVAAAAVVAGAVV